MGFRAWGLRLRVLSSGFRVWGLGFRVPQKTLAPSTLLQGGEVLGLLLHELCGLPETGSWDLGTLRLFV